jgi:hypothetical protein
MTLPPNSASPHDNSAQLRSAAKVKVPCAKCGKAISQHSMGRHLSTCNGTQQPSNRLRHDPCACGRKKASLGRVCFRCGDRDPIFDALDAAIAAGTQPGSSPSVPPVSKSASLANTQSEAQA